MTGDGRSQQRATAPAAVGYQMLPTGVTTGGSGGRPAIVGPSPYGPIFAAGDTVEVAWESVGGGYAPWTATVTAAGIRKGKGTGGLTVVYASDGSTDFIEGKDVPFCVTRARGGDGHGPAAPKIQGYTCCGQRFGCAVDLEEHERVHATRHKSFYCSFCPRQFGWQSDATRHERTHTGEKPYACSMCPKRFTLKSAVPRHERTHTGEKPYACSICPVRFANKSSVPPHVRTHTGEKPYACSICPS